MPGLPINLDEICGRVAIEFWLIEFIVLENLCAKSIPSGETNLTIFDNDPIKEKKKNLGIPRFLDNSNIKIFARKERRGKETRFPSNLTMYHRRKRSCILLRLRAPHSRVVKYRDSLFTRNQSANNTWTIFNFNFQRHTRHPNFDAISSTLLPPLSNTWLN